MKRVVSVSIGSSTRDHSIQTELFGDTYKVERIGTNGSIPKAIELIRELDGKVDAFGIGGIDLYLNGANKTFMIKEALPIVNAAKTTPVVDGTGIKNTLEKRLIKHLHEKNIISIAGKKVLLVCAIDRFKMAEAFFDIGCETILGDLIFALGIPAPIRSLTVFKRVVNTLLPVVSKLPFELLYPVGEKQEKVNRSKKFDKYYHDSDIIAGDFLYIKKYLPEDLTDKIFITNTVTQADVDMLKQRGAAVLITTTPEFAGRSFGTNVLEAILVAASDKKKAELIEDDYIKMIDKMNYRPRVEYFDPLAGIGSIRM